MAHFIGFLNGQRGEASRLGGKDSGIRTRVQGWDIGVKVSGRYDNGADIFEISVTSGSNGSSDCAPLATVSKEHGVTVIRLPSTNPIVATLEHILKCIGDAATATGAFEREAATSQLNAAVASARSTLNEFKMKS